MSQISSVFDCLLEEEERSLKENSVDSVQWAQVVLTVNNIIKVRSSFQSTEREDDTDSHSVKQNHFTSSVLSVCSQDSLQAAGQYRDTKASMYRASESAAAEPEYIPWTGKQTHLCVCDSSFSCLQLQSGSFLVLCC